jgi:uncharacterized membrane protein
MSLILVLHMLSAVIWVGGMFFAYLALRPAADAVLEPQVKLRLWAAVFARFFPWIWLTVVVLLVTGVWAVFGVMGGVAAAGAAVHVMMGLGGLMILIFLHVYFAPFRRLRQAVAASDWELAAGKANQIRILIAVNLVLGLIVVCVAAAGRYH